MQKPRYKDVTFECIHLSINKPSLNSNIIEQCVGDLSLSAWICTWTCEFMDKTPQIAEEQLIMMMDKAQETKLWRYKSKRFGFFLLTSAKAKKFQDGNWLIRLYTAIFLQLRSFSKIGTIVYQKDSHSFQQWVQPEAKRSILQDHEVAHRNTITQTHTHTQTNCYNPPPTLGLKS